MRILFFMLCIVSAFAEEMDLSQYERSFYSQHGEDGVLSKIMHELDPTNRYFLDLGGKKKSAGHLSYFFKMQGWEGISINRVYDKPKFMVFKEYATADNLFDLLKKHKARREIYLLIVDVDYNDFYIWKKIEEKYKPAVVVIKYNGTRYTKKTKSSNTTLFIVGMAPIILERVFALCIILESRKGIPSYMRIRQELICFSFARKS